jgi:hypothetical protein
MRRSHQKREEVTLVKELFRRVKKIHCRKETVRDNSLRHEIVETLAKPPGNATS